MGYMGQDAQSGFDDGMRINEMRDRAHGTSKAKGWYDSDLGPKNIPEMLALLHSEVSEALEDYRVGKMKTEIRADGKPEGFPSELADIVIRVGDLAGYLGINLDDEICKKMAFNATRPHRHGGKRA